MGNLLDTVTGRRALRQRAEAAEAARDVEKAARDVEKALRCGTYYSTVELVWRCEEVEFSASDLNAIQRPEPHLFYTKTYDAAAGNVLDPADNAGRSAYDPATASSLAYNEDDTKTEKSRKRRLDVTAIDGAPRDAAEVAHLIPYSPNCAHFYGPLAEAAVGGLDGLDGLDGSDALLLTANQKRRQLVLLHGQYDELATTSSGNKVRKTDTGIKHCRTNMARVTAQKRYLDFDPSLLIVPILRRDETLAYKGGKYDVLVACTSPKVYVETILTGNYELCSMEEIDTATATLTSFVKAAAFTLQSADRGEIESKLQGPEKSRILKSKGEIESSHRVKVPVVKIQPPTLTTTTTTSASLASLRLAKLTLDMKDANAHQECDPFLLFVKAAVVWSSIHDQKLLPGCSFPHDCEQCLAQGLFECQCEAYDPDMPIPDEIHVPLENQVTNELMQTQEYI
jgi:hypothetical protein